MSVFTQRSVFSLAKITVEDVRHFPLPNSAEQAFDTCNLVFRNTYGEVERIQLFSKLGEMENIVAGITRATHISRITGAKANALRKAREVV